jgi:hypothetical protein
VLLLCLSYLLLQLPPFVFEVFSGGWSDEGVWVEEGYVLIICLASIHSWGSGEEVCRGVEFPWHMLDLQVVFLEFCEPSCYAAVYLVWGFPEGQVRVVSEDCDWDC